MKYHKQIDSPLGFITLQANDTGLLGAWFETQTTQPDDLGEQTLQHPILQQAEAALQDYFNGQKKRFNVPIAASGTEFQKRVWQALTTIPFGETRSYQDLANAIGNPKAVRAVGLANGKNPVSILVPCHRVIGSNGKLTGYAGGIERKAWLLKHEGLT
jgi:methylated-DNA-[protein]-cysteine S-methyltransferase